MGLDQYAIQLLPGTDEEGRRNERKLAYWRKHPNLQGWMEALWRSKGLDAACLATPEPSVGDTGDYAGLDCTDVFGEEKVFNCEDLPLTVEDIRALREAVKGNRLPSTQGFFFGKDSDDHYREQDLAFCDEAEAILAAGGEVIYTSWW